MTEVTTTEIKFANVEDLVIMEGDQDADTIKEQFVVFYPYLANCTYNETIDAETGTKTIVFAERLGTKGC